MKNTMFGICASLVYTGSICYFRWPDLSKIQSLPLNEFGDFLAGIFGPLTLFWLVLGYIQQGKELKQNTKALDLQIQELKESNKQHREILEATSRQVETETKNLKLNEEKAIKEKLPDFSLIDIVQCAGRNNIYNLKVTFKNTGKPAYNVNIKTDTDILDMKGGTMSSVSTGESIIATWYTILSEPEIPNYLPSDFPILIEFTTEAIGRSTQTFILQLDSDRLYKFKKAFSHHC